MMADESRGAPPLLSATLPVRDCIAAGSLLCVDVREVHEGFGTSSRPRSSKRKTSLMNTPVLVPANITPVVYPFTLRVRNPSGRRTRLGCEETSLWAFGPWQSMRDTSHRVGLRFQAMSRMAFGGRTRDIGPSSLAIRPPAGENCLHHLVLEEYRLLLHQVTPVTPP